MSDLDTLRPEVREAMVRLGNYLHITIDGKHFRSEDYDTIRTELLRLASENMELRGANKRLKFLLDSAEAELAALKARIADSRTTDVFESEGHAGMVAMGGLPCEWIGKNVRLVVED